MRFEVGAEIHLFLCLIRSFKALLGGFGLLGGDISIHDTHVVNNVRPLHPEVSNYDIPL